MFHVSFAYAFFEEFAATQPISRLQKKAIFMAREPECRTVLYLYLVEDDQMSFVSITTWRMIGDTETLQHVTDLMQRKYFPGLLAVGALHSMLVDVELDRFAIVTVYPSRAVRDDAVAHISALRIQGAEDFGAELMDAYGGEMLAASEA
jgi:hypothetical protein